VLLATDPAGPFTRVNPADQIETSFVYARRPGAVGFVRIRAIDYWGRVLGTSTTVALP